MVIQSYTHTYVLIVGMYKQLFGWKKELKGSTYIKNNVDCKIYTLLSFWVNPDPFRAIKGYGSTKTS